MAYTKQTWLDRVGTFLNRFTKSNETLSTVELVNNPGTITQEGTAFSASRMNYMESGIENAHRIATPLSDLSRVMRINGDGVPMFPDNVAGIVYKSLFSTVDGWTCAGGTISVSGGELLITATASNVFIARIAAYGTNKLIRICFLSPRSGVGLYGTVGGIADTLIKSMPELKANVKTFIDGFSVGALTKITIAQGGLSVGDVIKISAVQIGTGLSDTPVYDKACCNRGTNYGAAPVPSHRGLGLLFQGHGKTPVVFDNPLIGSTGTIRFKLKTDATLAAGYYFGNYAASAGLNLYQDIAGDANIAGFSLGNLAPNTEYTYSFHAAETNLYVYRNGALTHTHTLSAPLVAGTSNFYISRVPLSADGQDFTLYDFEYVAEAETLDAHIRFMNGDDAVDSQQKSVTPVPHSIVTRGANGEINASNMFAYDLVIDSDAKLAAWAASGTWEKVLIKKGTWTLASGGVDLTARGTKCVIGEPESKLVFSSAEKGLYYTTAPTTKDYRMDGVTVEATGTSNTVGFSSCTNIINCTGTGNGTGNGNGYGFDRCTNIINCTGTGTGSDFGFGFDRCTNITNCTGTGNGDGAGFGFDRCTNIINCTGTGTGTGNGDGVGFDNCKKCQQNTATGTTAKYNASYADSGTSYACADTPNGGFNS